jgi:glyoxylase I family protein
VARNVSAAPAQIEYKASVDAGRLSLHHLAITVVDLALAERFYAGVLGLPVERRWADAAGAPRSIWVGLGAGAFLAIERYSGDAGARAVDVPGWHCVALGIAVEARASWRERLADAGFPVERESDFTLYVRDPEKNLVALSHYPEAG